MIFFTKSQKIILHLNVCKFCAYREELECWVLTLPYLSSAPLYALMRGVANAVFTLDVCVCVNVTLMFNIVSMETQTQTHRMGLNPLLTFSIDTVFNLTVTLTKTQAQTSSVNTALDPH